MTSKVKKVARKLGEFAEAKREQAIINITNSTAMGLLVKWIFTNKATVALLLIIMLGGAYYTYELDYYRELADRQRIQELTEDLAIEQAKTEQLNREIQAFKDKKGVDSQINKELSKTVTSLSAKKKKKLLLEYRDRLLSKRGQGQ